MLYSSQVKREIQGPVDTTSGDRAVRKTGYWSFRPLSKQQHKRGQPRSSNEDVKLSISMIGL